MYLSLRKWGFAKNLSFIVFMLMAIVALAACNSNASSNGKTGYTAPDENEAEKVITFNNTLVEIDDRNNHYLSQVKSNIAKIVEKITIAVHHQLHRRSF